MAIVRWELFENLLNARRGFNRLFNDTFSRFFRDESLPWVSNWVPSVDIYETDKSIVLKVELPGVDPKDIEAQIDGNTLHLRGERKPERKDDRYVLLDRSCGHFARSFPLPSSIETDKVNAEFNNGILTLIMPKRKDAKPKTIKVLAGKN